MTCPVCGEDHGEAGVLPGEPGNVLEGMNIMICPRLPDEWIWVAQSYEHGPDGLIIDLMAPQSQPRRIRPDG